MLDPHLPAPNTSSDIVARPPGRGLSSTEKLIGAYAAYQAPLVAGIAAKGLARDETDPERRREVERLGRASLLVWGVCVAVGLFALVVVLVSLDSGRLGPHGGGPGSGGRCHGGPDRYAVEDISYASADGVHWTGTYPCVDGGTTTIAVPRGEVPGASLH